MAISDPQGILATPLTVIADRDEDVLIDEVLKLVEQHQAGRVVVGLPRRLTGEAGEQATKVTAFADKLSVRAGRTNLGHLDVQLWDERFSTRAAERLKAEASGRGGKSSSGARRGLRKDRYPIKAEVDAVAAALILQSFLDSRPSEQ